MWYYYVRDSKQEDSIERILKRELGLNRKQISRLKFQENGLSVDGCQIPRKNVCIKNISPE